MRLDHLLSERKVKASVYGAVLEHGSLFPEPSSRRGDLAQLARASALQAEGQGFKSPNLHRVSSLKYRGKETK